ncbi:serine/threonine-protein kinase 32B isoform X2 [Lingula anatina]|nr:serine/threonine-protein kinase 32B isoform X2 [Lingula anatina]|eukprot:XP_013395055.1 serine/threonine-protein kinase 32B isoform X2 [Lingula anatina]
MKYMNKMMCIEKDAVRNVFREQEILQTVDHPFLVNLWFSFQDEEDMCMVVDLLLGGDLRYHMLQNVSFDESCVKLYICEIALALEYLQSKGIIHRDIKPDNILLDEAGHVHLTDFNVATVLLDGQLATSMSGTKPYMAPEVFSCSVDECNGYSYPVDWWSLGIMAYEILRGKRPFEIHVNTPVPDVLLMFASQKVHFSSTISDGMKDLLQKLLSVDPRSRMCKLQHMENHVYMADVDFSKVLRCEVKPSFIPAKDHLNCDPTFELEEMIIEAKPLHKKKKRLAKTASTKSNQTSQGDVDPMQLCLENLEREFKPFNREKAKLMHNEAVSGEVEQTGIGS